MNFCKTPFPKCGSICLLKRCIYIYRCIVTSISQISNIYPNTLYLIPMQLTILIYSYKVDFRLIKFTDVGTLVLWCTFLPRKFLLLFQFPCYRLISIFSRSWVYLGIRCVLSCSLQPPSLLVYNVTQLSQLLDLLSNDQKSLSFRVHFTLSRRPFLFPFFFFCHSFWITSCLITIVVLLLLFCSWKAPPLNSITRLLFYDVVVRDDDGFIISSLRLTGLSHPSLCFIFFRSDIFPRSLLRSWLKSSQPSAHRWAHRGLQDLECMETLFCELLLNGLLFLLQKQVSNMSSSNSKGLFDHEWSFFRTCLNILFCIRWFGCVYGYIFICSFLLH